MGAFLLDFSKTLSNIINKLNNRYLLTLRKENKILYVMCS